MAVKDVEVPLDDHKEVAEEMDDIQNDLKSEAFNEAAMDAELQQLEAQLGSVKQSRLELTFANPAYLRSGRLCVYGWSTLWSGSVVDQRCEPHHAQGFASVRLAS